MGSMGFAACLLHIYRERGWRAWFAGMEAKLLQTVLTAAFQLMTYEQIVRVLSALIKARSRGPSATLVQRATA